MGKVIQGFFIGGQVRRQAALVQPKSLIGHAPPRPVAARLPAMGAADSFQVDPSRLGLVSSGGRPLPEPVRQKMEAAFGADFLAVRVHEGPHAEKIGAVAFTTGSDIYIAPGRFQPDSIPGQQLLGHELAHVVQQRAGRVPNPYGGGVAVVQNRTLEAEADRLGHRAAAWRMPVQLKPAALPRSAPSGVAQHKAVVQRTLVGTDPLNDLSDPNAKGLVYGTSTARKLTSARLQQQDVVLGIDRYRTIDDYNDHIGLSGFMGGNTDPCNIFVVREALNDASPVANWHTHIPKYNGVDATTDQDLVDWINMLVQHRDYIGLTDLGDDSGKKKLGIKFLSSSTRYKKNFISDSRYKTSDLTAEHIRDWLSAKTLAQAKLDVVNLGTYKTDLGLWIRKAFWRRTSKLGIDFTIGRGFKIHINIAGDRKFNPSKGGTMKLRPGELKKVNMTYGRLITTSEYRHLKKGVKKGTLDANLVNFYSEF